MLDTAKSLHMLKLCLVIRQFFSHTKNVLRFIHWDYWELPNHNGYIQDWVTPGGYFETGQNWLYLSFWSWQSNENFWELSQHGMSDFVWSPCIQSQIKRGVQKILKTCLKTTRFTVEENGPRIDFLQLPLQLYQFLKWANLKFSAAYTLSKELEINLSSKFNIFQSF